nr:hypothetical protein [Tanacetum cinerariifolium]
MSGSSGYLEGSRNEDFPAILMFGLIIVSEGLAVLKLLVLLVGFSPAA